MTKQPEPLRSLGSAIVLVAVVSVAVIILAKPDSPLLQILAISPALPGLAYFVTWMKMRNEPEAHS